MYLQEFPNIDWLRAQARNNFRNKRAVNGLHLTEVGWPSVILNATSGPTERDQIVGPFSIFLNLSGQSVVRTDERTCRVTTDFYCLSNKGQIYDLRIPVTTETFNIHFGQTLYADVTSVLTRTNRTLLDQGPELTPINFELSPKLHWKSPEFSRRIRQIMHCSSTSAGSPDDCAREYDLLSELLVYLLQENARHLNRIEHIKSVKPATRKELLRRISKATDYLHENAFTNLQLDAVSRTCGLSKFHLLRVFKAVYGLTPQQYVSSLRLAKARQLLATTNWSIQEIAVTLGFSELPAFTRFFKKQCGISPRCFRIQN